MRARLREILAFLVVGGLSAGIDAGGFLILHAVGVMPVLASAISFLTSVGFNYLLNRSVVFKASQQRGTLWRYLAMVLINVALGSGLVAAGIAIGLDPFAAKVISIAVTASFNYVGMRRWVFRHRPPTPPGSAEPPSSPDAPAVPR